jgi:DNA modification methylase
LNSINNVDYIVTSPPYHNILKNDSKGLREDKSNKGYRSGSRLGIQYYSEKINDLGNQNSYDDFLGLFKNIMQKAYIKLNNHKYCSIIISDFTVEKKEVCVQADIVNIMKDVGFIFVGTIVLLQNHKPLYPFGYPYSFKINHTHQNILNFIKQE